MRSTCLILLFAMAAILAFFEVNAEPLAEPLADANPTATTRRRGRPLRQVLTKDLIHLIDLIHEIV
ncbi:vespakinin T precursor [Vespula maculifrons]|uniref:Vespakinin T n=1 Tax=Vespula maculifrons TaxID=7453 RepID=A0ABD2BIW6_VESMC